MCGQLRRVRRHLGHDTQLSYDVRGAVGRFGETISEDALGVIEQEAKESVAFDNFFME